MISLYDPVTINATGQKGWVLGDRGGPGGQTEYHVDGTDIEMSDWFIEADLSPRIRPMMPAIGSLVKCYAQDCEVLHHDWAAGTLYLVAPQPIKDGAFECLHRYPNVPQAHLAIWHGESSELMDVTTACTFVDGETWVALPQFLKLRFNSAMGPWANVEDGDLRVVLADSATVEFQVTVSQKANNYAIFGYGWDGAPAVEFGRILLAGAAPARYTLTRTVQVAEAGHLLAFYISSDDATKALLWSDGELVIK
jgi:hypothetical protein